ncbi:MAG: hypothetical protein AAF141_03425 [Pseudomonadota bacterium]
MSDILITQSLTRDAIVPTPRREEFDVWGAPGLGGEELGLERT